MDRDATLIQQLADGSFHSGSRLAERLGVSRTAVWKNLQRLQQHYGLEIHSVKGRGYRLAQPIELLDARSIQQSCAASHLMSSLTVHQSIDSTNQWLLDQPRDKLHGCVCLAERQSSGRGRRGRTWVSPFGQSLYLSIGWQFRCSVAELSGLSLAAGVAVALALEQLHITGVGLKWPNDLLWQEQKLAGLLLEVSGEQGGPSRVVLGLGLNYALSRDAAAAIDQPWMDLAGICGDQLPSRNLVASRLVDALLETLQRFEYQGLAPLIDSWNRFDVHRDRPVTLLLGDEQVEGVHRGIDANGALLLETAEGLRTYHGGEVSLRRGP